MSTVTRPQITQTPDDLAAEQRDRNTKSAPKKKGPADPRTAALWRFAISISVFTTLGAFWLGFEDSWAQPLVALATSYTLEVVLETFEAYSCGRPVRYRGGGVRGFVEFMLPAHITALSIALLLYPGARLVPIVFAVAIAACSKSIFTTCIKGKKKHFMNPSNLGIVVTLLAFPSVGIAPPYQFTENVNHTVLAILLPLGVLMAGTMLNAKLTKKWPLIVGWLGGFAAQGILRSLILGGPLLAPLIPFTGLVFWLYTNYMITDPGTTPFKKRNQVIFGATTALVYGILVVAHVVFAIFIALTIVCAMRGLTCAAPRWRTALATRLGASGGRMSEPAREVAS